MADEMTGPAKAPRVPTVEPLGTDGELTDFFQKVQKERGRPLFILASHFIDEEVAAEVCSWRHELREAGRGNELDILIHSPGGDLASCYSVARLFARCTKSWDALVPTSADSGATLICLGASKLIMSEIAHLSPLDPQVLSKRREKFFQSERQSPLEAFQAVRYLRKFSLESLDSTMTFLLDHRVAPHLALETAARVSIQFVHPILQQIEPYDLGAFALDSTLAMDYCKRVGNPADVAKQTQRGVDARRLVETYPAHEFVIDQEEAQELNFVVSQPTPEVDRLFDQLRPHLDRIHLYVGLITAQ